MCRSRRRFISRMNQQRKAKNKETTRKRESIINGALGDSFISISNAFLASSNSPHRKHCCCLPACLPVLRPFIPHQFRVFLFMLCASLCCVHPLCVSHVEVVVGDVSLVHAAPPPFSVDLGPAAAALHRVSLCSCPRLLTDSAHSSSSLLLFFFIICVCVCVYTFLFVPTTTITSPFGQRTVKEEEGDEGDPGA